MKKINLDFTSLLDILLILLFAFIINSNAQVQQKEEAMQSQLEKANAQASELGKLLSEKDMEQKELEKKLVEAETQKLQQELYTAQYKVELDNALETIRQQAKSPNLTMQTWHNYKVMANKFLVLNVSIVSPENQLIINEKKMPFFLSYEEVSEEDTRSKKLTQLEDLIEKEIDNSINSGNLILISAGKDGKIERQIYLLLWDAIRNIETKYGKDKLFKTEFYLP